MGKGDKKTRKGKQFRGSYGNSRLKNKKIKKNEDEDNDNEDTIPPITIDNLTKLKLMEILLQTVRIFGFRGIKNLEVNLAPTTILTGMNNTGKTSFLKALQIALGNRQFISQDDFYMSDNSVTDKIIVDIKIIPINQDYEQIDEFPRKWDTLLTEDRIRTDLDGSNSFVPLRTIVTFDSVKNSFKSKQFILPTWPDFFNQGTDIHWYQTENGVEKTFFFDEIPFFYMDAQRDIIEDIKLKNSYLGRMISKIEYSPEDIQRIETQIEALNLEAVSSSPVLTNICNALETLPTTMNASSGGIEITPFTKKIRDLNKGLTIYYNDNSESFSMEYHGMGTRSWASLLTLKSFINLLKTNAGEITPFFPILAIEEPEAHLHPNAQKNLYSQISSIAGQKIISTHSPYIVASGKLSEIRNLYKKRGDIESGLIKTELLTPEELRKINRQVINTRGELFFSKAIVFFEGETEEQAFPIFTEQYFSKTAIETGIDYVGVGGSGNYFPFISIAQGLNIPWFIFSDGETDTIRKVTRALKKVYNREEISLEDESNIFILNNGNDFENYLIQENYLDEITQAFTILHDENYLEDQIRRKNGTVRGRIRTDETCETCNQNIYQELIRDYSGDEGFQRALYDTMTSQKTKFGPVIAQTIIDSDKELPPLVVSLFDEINTIL